MEKCSYCGTKMVKKWILESKVPRMQPILYQCPECKNIDIIVENDN